MLFRNVIFLSALVASASASVVHPLLVARQAPVQCQSQCALVSQKEPDIQSGTCDMSCICTNTFINSVTSCLNCLQAAGQSLNGVPPNFAQQLTSECDAAGYPVSGSSSSGGSSSGSSSGGSLGGSGTTTTTAGSSKTTGGSSSGSSSGGLTLGKNGAMGLSANLGGVLAVAVAASVVVFSV